MSDTFFDDETTPQNEAAMLQNRANRRWAKADNLFYGAGTTRQELPAGVYTCSLRPQIGPVLVRREVYCDDLLELPDEAVTETLKEFDVFWSRREAFKQRGFLHKRGILLWGPPGSGKTSAIQIMTRKLIEANGIVVYIDHPEIGAACLELVRQIEPDRPVIGLLEDVDAIADMHDTSDVLALLDGELQIDNVVFIATTNYPNKLDRRFLDRPSRFDTVRYVGFPSAQARRVYLQAKEPSLSEAELEQWVEISDEFAIAHLKEMIIGNRCFGQPIDDVVERLRAMREPLPSAAGYMAHFPTPKPQRNGETVWGADSEQQEGFPG